MTEKMTKKEWRAFMKEAKELPSDYWTVFREIRNYLYMIWPKNSYDVLREILRVFQEAAAEGKAVLDITTNDVAAFVDAVIGDEPAAGEVEAGKAVQEAMDKYEEKL